MVSCLNKYVTSALCDCLASYTDVYDLTYNNTGSRITGLLHFVRSPSTQNKFCATLNLDTEIFGANFQFKFNNTNTWLFYSEDSYII